MYFPTTRMLTVLELLQANSEITAAELARRLEVDTRSIRRYVMMLQDMGIPVEATRGRYGAYHLERGFKLPPLMFTDAEVTALTLGLLAIRELQFPVDMVAITGALAKIERVMPENLLERTRGLQETITFNVLPPPTRIENNFILILSSAIQRCQRVKIKYTSWQNETSERLFDLYGIVFHESYWYTSGYCHLRKALRTFRIDRMLHVEAVDNHYERPADFDTLNYVIQSLTNAPGGGSVEILLMTSLENARRFIPPEVGTLEVAEEGVLFRRPAQRLEWIARMLLGLDFPMKIIQPKKLVEVMQNIAQKAVAAVASVT